MRLGGQAKMGFFPAPPRAVAEVAKHLRPPQEPFTLLDPCAGEGKAVMQLSRHLRMPATGVYMIELDNARGAVAAAQGGTTLAPCSFFGSKVSPNAFQVCWLNPPFDNELGGGRVEYSFLQRATQLLAPKGVLCFVVPEAVSAWYDVRGLLLQWYTDFRVVKFPEEVRDYGEVCVLAVKRRTPVEQWQQHWHEMQAAEDFKYEIPPGLGPRRFEKFELTEPELEEAMQESPLRKLVLSPPAEPPPAKPPLSLHTGHVALLLASGHLDSIVRPEGEPPHVVRGTARKTEWMQSENIEEDDNGNVKTTRVISEKMALVVRAVDAEGDIVTYED